MNLVKGKTAMVTGGASGIGACIVNKLALGGAKQIAIIDINLEGAEKLAEKLSKEHNCSSRLLSYVSKSQWR